MIPRKILPILLLSLAVLLQTSPSPLHALALVPAGLTLVPIPAGTSPVPPITQTDLDGNGHSETLALSAGRLSILSGHSTVWQSPPDWQVLQAALTGLDGDGLPEVTLLLWRPFRPWPVDQWLPNGGRLSAFHNAAGNSCHLILIGWRRGGFREVWAGSALADPITSFAAMDMDGNNTQELVTLEGRYANSSSAPARTLKVWQWNGFGFSVVSSMDGTFSHMSLIRASDGHILILVP